VVGVEVAVGPMSNRDDELTDEAMHRSDYADLTGPFPIDNPAQAERVFDRLMAMWERYNRAQTDEEYFRELDERIKHEF
jgi:hypothetical protein